MLPGVRQPQKRLVHQRRRLQGVAAPLAAHVRASQAAQLRLHERYQLLERAIIAVAPRPQQCRSPLRVTRSSRPSDRKYRSFPRSGLAQNVAFLAAF